jgi:hypothetical protein
MARSKFFVAMSPALARVADDSRSGRARKRKPRRRVVRRRNRSRSLS